MPRRIFTLGAHDQMKALGTSIAVFGGVVFASGIILAPILDALTIDPIALFLMLMGVELRRGKRRDITWPAIGSGWYCVLAAILIALAITAPSRVRVGTFHLRDGGQVVVVVLMSLALIWSGFNLLGLLKARRNGIPEPDASENPPQGAGPPGQQLRKPPP